MSIVTKATAIRVLHVVPTLGMGGTEKNGVRFAKFLVETGEFENQIIANFPGDESMMSAFEETSSHPILTLPQGRFSRLRAFYSAIVKTQPNAIVFHFFNIDQALMGLVARFVGIKNCLTAAGTAATDLTFSTWLKWKLVLYLTKTSKIPIVSASHWIEKTLESLTKLSSGSRVVHNGIEFEYFKKIHFSNSEPSRKSDKWALGMVSRLEGAKDHASLMRGFKMFIDQVPQANAELRIIGDGPLRYDLERLAHELDLIDHIIFLGTRTDVPEQLVELDVFVFSTTRKEGFGNVLIEALAAGIPIIANDVPSSKEVLREGQLGKLLPSGSPENWAEALAQHWHEGPTLTLPELDEIEEAYGITQFCNGYLDALGLNKANEGKKNDVT